jgi:hypothetical protein
MNLYSEMPYSRRFMTTNNRSLNRFERLLFRLAVVLATVVIVVRIGALMFASFFRHAR